MLNCDKPHLAKKLCSKHYYRQKRGQSVLGQSRFDRRPAVVEDGVTKLVLANGKGHTIVDFGNRHLDRHNWSLDGRGYPCTWIDGKIVKIHHLVAGNPPAGHVTDHINRDKLDNRLENLRFVTQAVNMSNSDMREARLLSNKKGDALWP
jgi:hypothetical protein